MEGLMVTTAGTAHVGRFRPSQNGLHFPNAFAPVALETVEIPGTSMRVSLGDASRGLCGGMVFTVIDYFENGLAPPPDRQPPSSGPLYDYLVKRLVDSWDLPGGVLRYLYLMNPELPDIDVPGSELGILPHGRAWEILDDEWPKVKADLDGSRLSPLGLIKVKSGDPAQRGQNHQVLAYGYLLNETRVTLQLYDPNAPDNDGVTLSFNLGDPSQPCALSCTTAPTLYCFFRTDYQKAGPPPGGVLLGT